MFFASGSRVYNVSGFKVHVRLSAQGIFIYIYMFSDESLAVEWVCRLQAPKAVTTIINLETLNTKPSWTCLYSHVGCLRKQAQRAMATAPA